MPQETLNILPDVNSGRIRRGATWRLSPTRAPNVLMADLAGQVVHIPHHLQGKRPCFRLHKTGGDRCVPRLDTSQPQGEERLFLQAVLGASPTTSTGPLAPGAPDESACMRKSAPPAESRALAGSGRTKAQSSRAPQTLWEGGSNPASAVVSPSMEP